MEQIQGKFRKLLYEKNIEITSKQLEQFEAYFRLLVEWNEKMNLTAITEREQVYIKHFYDSVSLSFFVPMNKQGMVADIGSGAGFPSIPLKIIYPHLKVTIIDSLNKRISFLDELSSKLGLNDMSCVHGRAEELGKNVSYREKFDLVTARAVARMNILTEFCLPFVRPNGIFAAMKGSDPDEETKEALFAIGQLGGALHQVYDFELPEENAKRHIIVVRKERKTPLKYPRKAGLPAKQPLI